MKCCYIELYEESVASDKSPQLLPRTDLKVRVSQSLKSSTLLINKMLEIWVSFIHRSLWEIDTRLGIDTVTCQLDNFML